MNSIMRKMEYSNMPIITRYDSQASRSYLRQVTNYSCAYCTISESESPGATFHIDHFRPKKYFVNLENEKTNLRYSCPRCNQHKGDHWISVKDGCIRDCEKCKTQLCKQSIERFIDCLSEEPEQYLDLSENDIIEPRNGSIIARYTISLLRLNRPQLKKLRYTRRLIDLWEKDLTDKKESKIRERQQHINNKAEFIKKFSNNHSMPLGINDDLIKLIGFLYDQLIYECDKVIIFLDDEKNNLSRLNSLRYGRDDN